MTCIHSEDLGGGRDWVGPWIKCTEPLESPHPRQPLTPQADAEVVVVTEVEAGEEREAGLVHEAGAAAEGAAQREVALATAQQVRQIFTV